MSQPDHSVLAELAGWIEDETGNRFPETHGGTILRAAETRCRELGVDHAELRGRLVFDEEARKGFLDGVMIGETYFFRDSRQFGILMSFILPALIAERRPLQLWSASCSTGEEAISLVAAVEGARTGASAPVDYSVLGTDINEGSLARLRAGSYGQGSFREDGMEYHALLEVLGERIGEEWQASPACLERITTRRLNLLSGALTPPDSMDVIFCRNTLLYMKPERKQQALDRLVSALRPGGFLFLASPEVPTMRHPGLETVERGGGFFFQKPSDPPTARARDQLHSSPRRSRPASFAAGTKEARHHQVPVHPVPEPSRPRDRRAARAPGLGDIGKGLALASSRGGSAPLGRETAPEAASERVAVIIRSIVAAIQANGFDRAEVLLGDFEAFAKENHVSQYLRALCAKHQGDLGAAIELWERARLFEPDFWPALFHAGLAYGTERPDRAGTLLRECLAAMDSDPGGDAFTILLEGFDAQYYRRMAARLLSRLGQD
ncbi:MAG: CheR family methyltransferase [Spirochaetota bacterium]